MTIKILRDSSTEVHNLLIYAESGNIAKDTVVIQRDDAIADAQFHRKRPTPLTDTSFSVTEMWENPTVFRQNGYPFIREGTLAHVYNSTGSVSKTYSDSGELALQRARHKISGRDSNFGETLVELNQTISMVYNRGKQVAAIFGALKSGNWSRLSDMVKGKVPDRVKRLPPSKRVSNGYLEFQFGWVPLYEDAYKAVEAYQKGILTRGSTVRSRSGPKRYPANQPITDFQGGNASFRGVVLNSNVATLNSLGLLNPALMAWNKLPLSFVLDWWLPISPILGSLTAEAGLTAVVQSRTSVSARDTSIRDIHYIGRRDYVRHPNLIGPPLAVTLNPSAQFELGKLLTISALIRQRI